MPQLEPTASPARNTPPELVLLYDGACPLCRREVEFLRRRDRQARLGLEDISAPGFDPARYRLDTAALMARIHGVLPDGRVVEGMEAFRRAYAAVGLGWLLAPSGWPLFSALFDRAYALFARHRLRWTGRCGADRCVPGRLPG